MASSLPTGGTWAACVVCEVASLSQGNDNSVLGVYNTNNISYGQSLYQILSSFANIGKDLMIFECFDLCKPISPV